MNGAGDGGLPVRAKTPDPRSLVRAAAYDLTLTGVLNDPVKGSPEDIVKRGCALSYQVNALLQGALLERYPRARDSTCGADLPDAQDSFFAGPYDPVQGRPPSCEDPDECNVGTDQYGGKLWPGPF